MKPSNSLIFFSIFFITLIIAGCKISQKNVANGNIVFQSANDGNYDLYMMNSDGSGQRNLTNSPPSITNTNNNFAPVPSPDGKQIAFMSDRDGNMEIYVLDIEKGSQINLSKDKANDDSPVWSPDGKKIAFESNRDGNYEIYVLDIESEAQVNLTKNKANDHFPTWSPDGKHIAFVSDRDVILPGINDIYVMNTDGSNVRKLTNNNKTNQYNGLSWSPDDANLAVDFSLSGPGAPFYAGGISLLTLKDLTLTELTSSFEERQKVETWSPDGKHIIYLAIASKFSNIYVMNADGTNQIALSKDPSILDTDPFWSPDGKQIVFSSRRDGTYHLYTMNADGTNQTRLTNSSGEEIFPVWLPAP
jgi:Tol biopolymer transport system component